MAVNPWGREGLEPPFLVRLSVPETIAVQALRQIQQYTPEKFEAALYLLQTMAHESLVEQPDNVVLITGRKLA